MTRVRLICPHNRFLTQPSQLLIRCWLLAALVSGCSFAAGSIAPATPSPTVPPVAQATATALPFNGDAAQVLQAGIQWLLAQQQADGSLAAPPAGPDATVTALLAISAQPPADHGQYSAIDAAVDSLVQSAPHWLPGIESGLLAKLVLALVNHGVDVVPFAGADLASLLNQALDRATGLYHGESLFRHSLAVRATAALQRPIPPGALEVLSRLQQSDGGWSWRIGADLRPVGRSDVDSTAAVLLALAAAGAGQEDPRIIAALAFLAEQQSPSGGWAMDANSIPNANSTGITLQALGALGLTTAVTYGIRASQAQQWLATLQQPDGSFHYAEPYAGAVLLATADAVAAFQWQFQE